MGFPHKYKMKFSNMHRYRLILTILVFLLSPLLAMSQTPIANRVKAKAERMKNGDIIAQSYRLVLELQDTNLVAKRQHGGYRDQAYEKKRNLLKELIGLCREHGWVYGYQSSSVIGVDSVIYFELPDMEQISFHTRMRELGGGIPPYPKPWNGKENYTLIAIEQAIMSRYGDAISALK